MQLRLINRNSVGFKIIITNTCVTRSYHHKFIFLSIMSVNDKVKVFWKTNCQWKDQLHWPKRKEIKLTNEDHVSEGKELLALKPGDAVKVWLTMVQR